MIIQKTALLLVHIQNDLLPGGSLAVPEGNLIISPANNLIRFFLENKRPVIATRDWHPDNHVSFLAFGGPWPAHCVRETRGAEFPVALKLPDSAVVFSKSMDAADDQYSAFRGKNFYGFDLRTHLEDHRVEHIVVAGLALDVCVLHTIIDALNIGLKVTLATDAVKAIDAVNGARALRALALRGVQLYTSSEITGIKERLYFEL